MVDENFKTTIINDSRTKRFQVYAYLDNKRWITPIHFRFLESPRPSSEFPGADRYFEAIGVRHR